MGQPTTSIAQLPPRLQEVAEQIGHKETAKLAKAYGGQKIKFPAQGNLPIDHPVRAIVTAEAAELLYKMFRGERVLIPSGVSYYRQQDILAALKAGFLPREIAEQIGVTTRSIEHIRCLLIAANSNPFPLAQSCA